MPIYCVSLLYVPDYQVVYTHANLLCKSAVCTWYCGKLYVGLTTVIGGLYPALVYTVQKWAFRDT